MTADGSPRDGAVTPRQAAERLGVTVRTVQRWVADGRLPARRVGGRVRVDLADVAAMAGPASIGAPAGRRPRDIRRLLIANRGEIAARVARTSRRLGIACVGVHVSGERPPTGFDTTEVVRDFLDGASILAAAERAGADAIHPGYGFLAENAEFAAEVERAGLIWVGPPPGAIATMGEKAGARRLAASRGVPVLPGYDREEQSDARLTAEAERVGWPLIVKPAAGGGGKGMHLVRERDGLVGALGAARREARGSFGDERLILERYIDGARHVEVQVLFDAHGTGIHLGTRDCSSQRRHQKVIEEAPAPGLGKEQTDAMGAAAVAVAAAVGYHNAGTVEFLLADDGGFYFLEMNTRLQVEHPVTELVTGRDLVADQLRVAAGEPLGLRQADVRVAGHAIEARLYAEDAERGFLPATGRIAALALPSGGGVRADAGVAEGDEISGRYDPLLAKIAAHGRDRPQALRRLHQALAETRLLGVTTNLRFLRWLLAQPVFAEAAMRTDTVEGMALPAPVEPPPEAWQAAAQALVGHVAAVGNAARPEWAGGWRLNTAPTVRLRHGDTERAVRLVGAEDGESAAAPVLADGSAFVDVQGQSVGFTLAGPPSVEEAARHAAHAESGAAMLTAPMPGRVIAIHAAVGASVEARQPLIVLEAMKMENAVVAPLAGTLARLHVRVGQQVQRGDLLAEVVP